MKHPGKIFLLLFMVLMAGAAGIAYANGVESSPAIEPQAAPNNGQATCPDGPVTGGTWYKIDSDDLSLYPVPGATAYCFKAGSDNSKGCVGGIFDSWPQPPGTCGLSHWSYFIPDGPTCQPPFTNSPPDCDDWVFSGEYKKCQSCTVYHTDSSGNSCGSTTTSECLVYACIDGEETWVPENEYSGPIGPCGEPGYEPFCTLKGETIWVQIGTEPPEGAEPGECKPSTPRKPPTKTCPNNCGGSCLWENPYGGGVDCEDENLYGTEPGGIFTAMVFSDCNVIDNECIFERYILAVTRTDIVDNFTVMDGDKPFYPPDAHLGADGNMWILYVNQVGEDRSIFNSWDDWTVVSDPQVPVYPYRPCCLAWSYAFTKECEDNSGNFCAIRMPGVCKDSLVSFNYKTGLFGDDLDNWYDEFKVLPLFTEYPLP